MVPEGYSFSEVTEYTVDGQTVTVTYDLPCKPGYLSGEGENAKYVALEAHKSEGSENTYTFEVPDGVDEVLLVIKGDTDSNGRVSQADSTKIKSYLGDTADLDIMQRFAGDVNGDGRVSFVDSTKIKAVLAGVMSAFWDW